MGRRFLECLIALIGDHAPSLVTWGKLVMSEQQFIFVWGASCLLNLEGCIRATRPQESTGNPFHYPSAGRIFRPSFGKGPQKRFPGPCGIKWRLADSL